MLFLNTCYIFYLKNKIWLFFLKSRSWSPLFPECIWFNNVHFMHFIRNCVLENKWQHQQQKVGASLNCNIIFNISVDFYLSITQIPLESKLH